VDQSARHLRLFSTAHYVFGALNLVASCLPAYFVIFALQMVPVSREAQFPLETPPYVLQMSRFFPYLFIAAGIASMIGGFIIGLAMLLAGYCLGRRAHYAIPAGAAQQLAEADPAGWALGWGAWPAGVRENRGCLPASAGQLSSRPLGRANHVSIVMVLPNVCRFNRTTRASHSPN
jgi:hypothetical protein